MKQTCLSRLSPGPLAVCCVTVVLIAALCCPRTVWSEERISDVVGAIEFLTTGMRQERAKWKSGEGRFTGQWRTANLSIDGSSEGYIAFDGGLDGGRVRWDWQGPGVVTKPGTTRPVGHAVTAQWKWDRVTWFYALDKSKMASYQSEAGFINVGRSSVSGWRKFWASGGNCPDELWAFPFMAAARKKDDFHAVVALFNKRAQSGANSTSYSVIKQNDGLWRLEVHLADGINVTTMTYVIDVNRGFTPIVFRYVDQPSADRLRKWEELWSKKDTLSKTERETLAKLRQNGARPIVKEERYSTFEQISGVWVPVEHKYRRFASPAADPSIEEERIFRFTWLKINEQLPDRLFSYEGFPLEETVPVYDSSAQSWIRGEPPQVAAPSAPLVTRPAIVLWLFVGILLIVVSAVLWALRYRVRPSP